MKQRWLSISVSVICLVIIGAQLYRGIAPRINAIKTPFNVPYYQDLYEHSPYHPENVQQGIIEDDELYTLAGFRYVTGQDVSSINFELQPLTKYLFGGSVLVFGNAIPAQILLSLILLVEVYFAAYLLFKQSSFSLIPVTLLVSDKLFLQQMTHPYLDIAQSIWILALLLLISRPKITNKISLLIGIVVAGIALSKSFMIGSIAAGIALGYLVIYRRITLKQSLAVGTIALSGYCLGYLPYFLHHSLSDFVTLHLNIIKLYRSNVPEYPKGEVFRIIFTGQWRRWFGDFGLAKVTEHTWLWPLSLLVTVISLFEKKVRKNVHLWWVIGYVIVISLKLVFPRYLLPILPSLYIMLVYQISRKLGIIKP